MLKQGAVQETLADLSNGATSAALPPLHNLPHWSRVNNFDKTRYPKPFLKDRLQPLPNPTETEMEGAATVIIHPNVSNSGLGSPEEDGQVDMTRGLNSGQRILHLEKSIQFLQQQHHEVLSSLHSEIDQLKRENKELQFHIVMMQKGTSPRGSAQSQRSRTNRPTSRTKDKTVAKTTASGPMRAPHPPSVPRPGATAHEESQESPHSDRHSQGSDEKVEELKIIFLEEEIKDLKKALKDERTRSNYLQQLVDRKGPRGSEKSVPVPHAEHKSHSAGVRGAPQPHPPAVPRGQEEPPSPKQAYNTPSPRYDTETLVQQELPYNASLSPLKVTLPNQPTRTPTVKECEVIVNHLQKLNDSQAHELNQLKSDLRDVLYSHKWTPDAFLLAKAYVAEDDAKEMAELGRLPKIEMKHGSRKLPDMAYVQKDSLSLPALTQTMGNKAIERRKRHQIIQKGRVNKELAN